MLARSTSALAIFAGALASGCACQDGRLVEIVEADLVVCAEVADTEAQRATGLRLSDGLGSDEGLLLEFNTEGNVCIVNTGVAFSIDAIFASNDGTVVAVERRIAANDEAARCHDSTRRVLELAAGTASAVRGGHQLR